MRPTRFRITLGRSMALVAVVAVVLGLGYLVFEVLPRDHPRFQHAALHRRLADVLLRQVEYKSPYLDSMRPELKRRMLDLAAWHLKRSDEIRRVRVYDKDAEDRIDAANERFKDDVNREFGDFDGMAY